MAADPPIRHPVQHVGCAVPGCQRYQNGSDSPPTAHERRDGGSEVCVDRHERPLIFGDSARVSERKVGGVTVDRQEPIPLGIPPHDEILDTRPRTEACSLGR